MTSDIELIEYGTPFSYDQRNKELFVTHNDFSFVVKEDMDKLCYYVYTWIKEDKKITKGKVIDFLDDCKSKRRYLTDFKLEKYTLTCSVKKEANTGLNTVNLNIFTKDLATWLAENLYLSCCAKCGEESDIFLDHINGNALMICDDCKQGKAKVFIDPTTPAPKHAEKPQKPEVDIFDLSDLMSPTDDDDELSDSADEAVIPVSDKDNEKPDMDRFESVSLDDEPIFDAEEPSDDIAAISAEESAPAEKITLVEEMAPAAVNESISIDEEIPSAADIAEKDDDIPPVSSRKTDADIDALFEELLPKKTEKPAEPKPAAKKPAEELSFEDMLSPVTPEPSKSEPKTAAKSVHKEELSFEEMLTPKTIEQPKAAAKPSAGSSEISIEDMLTPVTGNAAQSAVAVGAANTAKSAQKQDIPAVTIPQGYSPDNPTDEKGAFYHPLMTKKSDAQPAEEMTAKVAEFASVDINNAVSEDSGLKIESMTQDKDELHDAFRHLAGNSKNIDVMIDREIGYKSKSDSDINKITQASGKNKEFLQSKGEVASSNVPLGIIGTLAFGAVAIACWVFVGFMLYNDLTLDSLGYIMGIFLAFAVVTGYQKIGHYLDTKGVIISFIMAIILTIVSVSGYTGLVIYDTLRCHSAENINESQAVCEYAMLDDASRTPEKLQEYLAKNWGNVEIIEGFKYALFYDDAYDYLSSEPLIESWFIKDGYTVMGRYYQDLILSFVVVAITFVLAVANAQNWKRSNKS